MLCSSEVDMCCGLPVSVDRMSLHRLEDEKPMHMEDWLVLCLETGNVEPSAALIHVSSSDGLILVHLAVSSFLCA